MVNKELDTELIQKLEKLGKANKYEEYLEVVNKALEQVEVRDNGEKMLYLPEHLPDVIFLNTENKEHSLPYLRETVVEMLKQAQKKLPAGYHLWLANVTRTKEIVLKLYKKYKKEFKEKYNISEKEADLQVRNVLAMPDDDAPPGHMTGGAVDVILADDNGELLPMKEDYEKIPREVQSFTDFKELPEELLKNRKILYKAMTSVGFQNYFREFWHYSYGDPYWAKRYKDKIAIYGVPPEELFEKLE